MLLFDNFTMALVGGLAVATPFILGFVFGWVTATLRAKRKYKWWRD